MYSFVINSRQFCGDNAAKAATEKRVLSNVKKLTVKMGRVVNNNHHMRSVNGNGKKRLLFSHLNLRGGDLTENIEKRTQWIATIGRTRPDVMGLSETNLGSNIDRVCDLAGYTWETKPDSPRISVLVNSSLDYKRRFDLEEPGIAAIWVELSPRSKSSIIVCQLYREWQLKGVPGTGGEPAQQERWEKFLAKFKQIAATNQEIHVCGDVNLDRNKWRQIVEDDDGEDEDEGYQSDTDQSPRSKRLPQGQQKMVDRLYEEILNVYDVVQMQRKISYIKVDKKNGKVTKSCLDLYFTNRPLKMSELRTCQTNDSDHHQILGYRRTRNKMPQPAVIKKRKWSKIDWPRFIKDFKECGAEAWITNCEETDNSAELLTAATRVHLDSQQKVKTFQLRHKYTPWVDENVKMIINRKKTLFEIWKRTQDKEDWSVYRKQSNYLVKVLRQRKTDYLKGQLRSTLQSQDVWKAARGELHMTGAGPPTALVVNGELTSNSEKMSESQNNFFISKVAGIGERIPKTDTDPLSYTKKFLQSKEVPGLDFRTRVVTEEEVSKVIDGLKNTTSCGHDDINVVALKNMKEAILTSLTYVVNLSLRKAEFPAIWKLAKVMPLHKSNGDKTDPSKYRPIALLPVFSKVLEKFVSLWLNEYLEVNGLWSDRQHGYRKHRSTATALLQLQEEILKKFEEGKDVAVLSFDSSAAFDTLTHSILVDKLKLYGCSDHVLAWFRSYLSDRWQYTEIGGKKSSTRRIVQGVFQGSILGPALYILYVNCISILQDDYTKFSLYADDQNAAIKLTKNKFENRVRLRVKAAEMKLFMDAHHLCFNEEKTKLIVKLKGVNNNHHYLNVQMGDKIIEQEETIKVLGIVIGKDEKYKEYLVDGKNSMTKFLNSRHSLLKMLSKYADKKTRKALAEGLILSKIQYCVSLWSTTNDTIIQKIHVFLNDVVRTVYGIGRNRFVSLSPLYKQLKWHNIRQMIQYHDTITVHSILKNGTPWDLAQKFHTQRAHSYWTRASQRAVTVNTETTSLNTVRSTAFVCRAAKHYQDLPIWLTKSKMLPRWAFKDFCRSEIGGWQMKEQTEEVTEYIKELRASGHEY